jgi:hypothetical protein
MLDFQTFIAILTALLFFLTGVFLNYDTIAFRNYQLIIPQWAGLLLAGITFTVVVLDQFLRGLVRLEETRQREEDSVRATNERLETTERETRRTRIENRYRIAIIRYQLNPNNLHRRQIADILAVLEEYQDTL